MPGRCASGGGNQFDLHLTEFQRVARPCSPIRLGIAYKIAVPVIHSFCVLVLPLQQQGKLNIASADSPVCVRTGASRLRSVTGWPWARSIITRHRRANFRGLGEVLSDICRDPSRLIASAAARLLLVVDVGEFLATADAVPAPGREAVWWPFTRPPNPEKRVTAARLL